MKMSKTFLTFLVAATVTSACEKNSLPDISAPLSGGAAVKYFNFSVGSPSVNFFVNDNKVTASNSLTCYLLTDANRAQCTSAGGEATTGIAYGSSANSANAWYSDTPTGSVKIDGKITATTDHNLAISTLQATTATGKYYSYYLSGIYDATAKKTDSFIVEDVMPTQDFTVANVRFVNASSTTQPMVLYLKDRVTGVETAIGPAVAYKSAGPFVSVPWNAAYDLSTRLPGSSTAIFTRTNVSFSSGGDYTITARGNTATASTMALDNTRNW